MRLVVALLLSGIGGVGMWSVIVALPAVQAEFGVARSAAALAYTVTMISLLREHLHGAPLRPLRHLRARRGRSDRALTRLRGRQPGDGALPVHRRRGWGDRRES